MGQCLARQRSPPLFRRVQVQPVHPMSPPTSPPLPKVKFEVENEPISSNDVGETSPQGSNPDDLPRLKQLPPLRNKKRLPIYLPPLRNTPRVYPYPQEPKKKVVKKVRWNEKELSNAESFVEVKHNAPAEPANEKAIKALVQDVTGHVDVIEVQPVNEVDDDDIWEKIIDENSRIKESAANFPKVQEGSLKSILKKENSKKNEGSKAFLDGSLQTGQTSASGKQQARRKRRSAAEIAHLAVSKQLFGSEGTSDSGKEKEKEREKCVMEPFWKLGDVPIKPVTLPSIEDIENEMKIIESEMQALLKPEEKYLKRSIAFTIAKADTGRSQTPGCVPQRLLKHHKSKVDRAKIVEKQREAEQRRNVNIANRVKSARRRSEVNKKNIPSKLEKERQHEREIQRKVDSKMKAAASRRNEILSQKSRAAKKEARTERLNEREKNISDVNKCKQEDKMNKISENKERVMRKKMRSLKYQDKKRQLARKRLARQKEDEEERCQTFVETETYDGDEDLGERDWD